jgi:hypothetical protein
VARILISTYRWGFIDDWVKVEVMGAVYNIWVVEETTGSAEEGLEDGEFSEEKTSPEKYGGGRWQEEVDGEYDQFSDEASAEGASGREVEDDIEEGAHSVQPVPTVDLGVNMGEGDLQMVRVQEARVQLEALIYEEPVGLRQVEGGVDALIYEEPVGLRQVEGGVEFEMLMGTGGERTEGKEGGMAESADGGQHELSRVEEKVARGFGSSQGACSSKCKQGDPAAGVSVGPAQLGLRISNFTKFEESTTMGERGATSKAWRKHKKCPTSLGMP